MLIRIKIINSKIYHKNYHLIKMSIKGFIIEITDGKVKKIVINGKNIKRKKKNLPHHPRTSLIYRKIKELDRII